MSDIELLIEHSFRLSFLHELLVSITNNIIILACQWRNTDNAHAFIVALSKETGTVMDYIYPGCSLTPLWRLISAVIDVESDKPQNMLH